MANFHKWEENATHVVKLPPGRWLKKGDVLQKGDLVCWGNAPMQYCEDVVGCWPYNPGFKIDDSPGYVEFFYRPDSKIKLDLR